MSKYHYTAEPKANAYRPSADYGKVFGWNVIDTNANRVAANYLLHETGVMVSRFPFSKKLIRWIDQTAKQNGHDAHITHLT